MLPLIISPDTKRKERVPPGQHEIKDFPVLHAGEIPRLAPEKWNFEITGLVEEPLKLSFAAFNSLPRVKLLCDIHCVTTWSKLDTSWQGVQASEIIKAARPKAGAEFAIVHGANDFTTNLRLEDFSQLDVVFALEYEEEPIPPEHGFPVRLVVPRLYFWKSAKWVTGVEFTAEDRPGFWESRGYHNRGDPWLEERFS